MTTATATASTMKSSALITALGQYTIGSAKHIRSIIECHQLAEVGTQELVQFLHTKNPAADTAGLKADSVRLLAAAGCYPLLTKKGGQLYGPKSIADKARQGKIALDSFGERCVRFALALERQIEYAVPSTKPSAGQRTSAAAVKTTSSEASEKAEGSGPKTVTSTKIVNPATESVRSQMAAKLAIALDMAVEMPELAAVIRECMKLLPTI